jgi:hypothetical protein
MIREQKVMLDEDLAELYGGLNPGSWREQCTEMGNRETEIMST